MRVRENLSGIVSHFGRKNQNSLPSPEKRIGKVYAVVTGIDTPTPLQYKRAGGEGALGSVFCLDFNKSKDIIGDFSDDFLNICTIVRPLSSNINFYPLVGELIDIIDASGPLSLVTINGDNKYYSSIINVWNNAQHNALVNETGSLGLSFTESSNIKSLLNFEGDLVIQGRKGNSLRFGMTSPFYSNINEWSSIGKNGDPITILSNGHNFSGEKYHVEKINEEASSIYLTSTQKLPIIPDRYYDINPITNPTLPFLYNKSQVIINGDRVVLNSKKDEVMIFAKTNIEISTNNVINLNANDRIHLNGNKIFLGTVPPQEENQPYRLPTEPVLLGRQTVLLLTDLIVALHSFSAGYSSKITPPPGVPFDTGEGAELMKNLQDITSNLSNLLSQTTYTA